LRRSRGDECRPQEHASTVIRHRPQHRRFRPSWNDGLQRGIQTNGPLRRALPDGCAE